MLFIHMCVFLCICTNVFLCLNMHACMMFLFSSSQMCRRQRRLQPSAERLLRELRA
jgi:hypothetical protein